MLVYLQVEIFLDHMELRPVFVYILRIYKKTTKNWQLWWLVMYCNI